MITYQLCAVMWKICAINGQFDAVIESCKTVAKKFKNKKYNRRKINEIQPRGASAMAKTCYLWVY